MGVVPPAMGVARITPKPLDRGGAAAPSGAAASPYLTIGNNCITQADSTPPTEPENVASKWVSGTSKKKATVLRLEMQDMAKTHGLYAVVTFTLTFADRPNRKEAERRFHSLHTNIIRKNFQCGLHVCERSGRGRLPMRF